MTWHDWLLGCAGMCLEAIRLDGEPLSVLLEVEHETASVRLGVEEPEPAAARIVDAALCAYRHRWPAPAGPALAAALHESGALALPEDVYVWVTTRALDYAPVPGATAAPR